MHATETLKEVPLFKTLSEEALARLEATAQHRQLQEGETLLSPGQPMRTLTVVTSGQLKCFRVNRAGKEQVFGYGRPGDVLGLGALTDPYATYPLSAVARVNGTEVTELDMGVARELLKTEPAFALTLLTEQGRRLRMMVDLVDQLSLKDAHNRLARWLDNWITANHPEADEHEFLVLLPFTQSEIAAQIGTVREVVSRGFSRMEKDGIVKASGKRITVLSRKRLRQMAEE